MKIIAIVQARMESLRLPGKVMKSINEVPLIGLLLRRLSLSKEIHQIILATSINPCNDSLVKYVTGLGYAVERGSEQDVLNRFFGAAKKNHADVIVRITGDCPLVDSELVDQAILDFKLGNYDYYSNVAPPTYPDGLDIEIFTYKALEQANLLAVDPYEREHVTPYLQNSDLFKIGSMRFDEDLSGLRWTVDEISDFLVIKNIFTFFYPKIDFSWRDVLALQIKNPSLFDNNKYLIRNEGVEMNAGNKLWRRAKNVIPGGNMLLSKRPEMFLPDKWPTYFSKAKGVKVWDLDGNEYIDMSLMGIGTNTLGYCHPEVDAAVQRTVIAGNMSTLNCPEEVYLAEKLIELHPWAHMVRFARSGGEANAIAIRIARAATGKDKVAICGYHGWHDWYLSANLNDDASLNGHLLPGLAPNGVPRELKGSVFPFTYNNFSELEDLVKREDIGVIKMEVSRNTGPENSFLQKVRQLATDKGIVLIFDECTSGFRETFGGLHQKYGVNPDMATFGKSLGNGYAITAVIGKREIMEAAQTTFISSTFWTERIGPTAALKTLEVMEQIRSWETLTKIGLDIRQGWDNLAKKHQLNIMHWGLPALTGFSFQGENSMAYKTLITQMMLSKGYLAGNSVYACVDHTHDVLDGYFDALEPIFAIIKECEEGRSVFDLLTGPVCHSGFKRLN